MSGLTDQTYNIGAGSTTLPHPITQSYSDCPITYSCEIYDDAGDYWVAVSDPPIVDCTSASGVEIEVVACVDTDTVLDDNSGTCQDYTDNSGAIPYLCDGTNNGSNGFDAAA